MKKIILSTLLLLTLSHGNIHIIASQNCQLESLSKPEIKKLFLVKKKSVSGEKVSVLDSTESDLYHQFVEEYLNKSVRKIKTYWVRMLFTGKRMPPQKVSVDELEALHDDSTCHLSYVKEEETVSKNWKIINLK